MTPTDMSFIVPTHALEVFDVSGAGDTVVAALALALSVGASIKTAASIGNAAAGIAVGKRGTAAVRARELAAALGGGESDGDPKIVDHEARAEIVAGLESPRPQGRLHQRLLRPASPRARRASQTLPGRLRPTGRRAQHRRLGPPPEGRLAAGPERIRAHRRDGGDRQRRSGDAVRRGHAAST